MKTIVIHVDGMISICDGLGVEKRLLRHPGIRRVDANFFSSTATVEYDETQVSLSDIKRLISKCGYACSGECLPSHICRLEGPAAANVVPSQYKQLAEERDKRSIQQR